MGTVTATCCVQRAALGLYVHGDHRRRGPRSMPDGDDSADTSDTAGETRGRLKGRSS
jgi:hypothetical protein